MFSLFSSFDLSIFSSSTMLMALFLITLSSYSVWKMSCFSIPVIYISNFLENFFCSLKPLSLSKSIKSVFLSIFFCFFLVNSISVLPYNFAFTSRFGLIFSFSLLCWMMFILFLFSKNLKGFLSHTIPEGTPMILVPFLFMIELVSIIIRPITLAVRLVANILAGHILMSLLSSLVVSHFSSMVLYITLVLVETLVSIIQSYIFVTMLMLYFAEV